MLDSDWFYLILICLPHYSFISPLNNSVISQAATANKPESTKTERANTAKDRVIILLSAVNYDV